MKRTFRFAIIASVISANASTSTFAGFDPVEETPGLMNQIAVLSLEAQDASAGAVARLNDLWAGSGGGIVHQEDGSVQSMAGWLYGLPAEQRTALMSTVDPNRNLDGPSFAVLPAVRAAAEGGTASPLELYARIRAVPLTADMGAALALVGDRALAWGDPANADAFYDMARQAGWSNDPRQSGASGKQPAATATPVAVATPWFGDPKKLQLARVLPVTVGDTTFISGPAGVVALKGDAVLWTNTWGEPDDIAAGAPLPGGAGRGPVLSPAVLSGMGTAQIMVVNTPATADLPGMLRAIRASDGRTVWQSNGDSAHDGVRFVGPATIVGRYVYAPGVQTNGMLTTLMVACIDITSGRSLWLAPLGNVTDTARSGNRRPLEHHWHQSAPFVSGDALFVAPGVGHVFALDRFNGRFLWARPYTVNEADDGEVQRFRNQLRSRQYATPPVHPLQVQRYAAGLGRSGNALVVAPLDTPATFGLDSLTGKVLWTRTEMDPPNLIAVTGNNAIYTGGKLVALDPATGVDRWTAALPEPPAGVVALVDGKLHVPTATAKLSVDPTNGTGATNVASLLEKPLAAEPVKEALKAIGAATSIGLDEKAK
ncbi:MAG TPA: PQQ-binding-like beta-propeller repeat protein [Tepidisphaeraceae bacterium]|jgi:outer membrane protein assembly factor BamB|nr:PQQ-binding-like beta-propeller repeat protein [Tepidisphaeraceae bacterium]